MAKFVTALLVHFAHIDVGDLRVLHEELLDFCQGAYNFLSGVSCLNKFEEVLHQLQTSALVCSEMGVLLGQVSGASIILRRKWCSARCRVSSVDTLASTVGSRKTLVGIVW